MIGAEIDLVGQGELGGGDAELVRLGGSLEDLVAARVFDLKGEFAVGGGLVVSAVERERADVDGLAGLVDGLLRGEEDGGLVLELDGLRVFGRADGRVGDVAQLVFAGEAGGKAELRFDGAAAVEAPGEERARLLVGDRASSMRTVPV